MGNGWPIPGEELVIERNLRFYYRGPDSKREPTKQERPFDVRAAVFSLIGQQQLEPSPMEERREQERVEFVQPVRVITDDHLDFTMLSRDLSTTGIRLIGAQRLLGRKVHVVIFRSGGAAIDFLVRILWTCPISDELVENGGVFLSATRSDMQRGESELAHDSSTVS
jgi:hypothetical protein